MLTYIHNKMKQNVTCNRLRPSRFPMSTLVPFLGKKLQVVKVALCNLGTLDALMKIIRYEGFHGFYKGMSTKIVQSVLAGAILFMVKEELVRGARWLLTGKSAANSIR